jgi:hypothetical protein
MMLAVLDLYNQDVEKNKQPDDDGDNDNLEVNKGNDRDEMDKNLHNSALVIATGTDFEQGRKHQKIPLTY